MTTSSPDCTAAMRWLQGLTNIGSEQQVESSLAVLIECKLPGREGLWPGAQIVSRQVKRPWASPTLCHRRADTGFDQWVHVIGALQPLHNPCARHIALVRQLWSIKSFRKVIRTSRPTATQTVLRATDKTPSAALRYAPLQVRGHRGCRYGLHSVCMGLNTVEGLAIGSPWCLTWTGSSTGQSTQCTTTRCSMGSR